MTTLMDHASTALYDRIDAFARERIAGRNFHRLDKLPPETWQALVDEGIVGIGIPERYGGRAGGWKDLAIAGTALVNGGGNLGIAVAWLLHSIVARFCLLEFGSETQKQTHLPELASGRQIACFAVSEPNSGAHPKTMRTTAVADNDTYTINGEKTYLTNGPVADLFVTVAVTRGAGADKRFTAFLIPRRAEGVTVTDPMVFPYLKPAAHGGIRMDACVLPQSRVLGVVDTAYRRLVVPFRWVEDAMMAGPVVGAMHHLLSRVAAQIGRQQIEKNDLLHYAMGDLLSVSHTSRILALETSSVLDRYGAHQVKPDFEGMLLGGRLLCRRFVDALEKLISETGIRLEEDAIQLQTDLDKLSSLAGNVARRKQQRLGAQFIGDHQ